MNGKETLEALYQRYQDNQCSEEEFLQLLHLISSDNAQTRQEVLRLFESTWNNLQVFPGQFNLPETVVPEGQEEEDEKVIPITKTPWKKYMAAAAVLILITVGAWWFTSQNKPASTQVAITPKQDLPPGREGAILTLADGRQVVLDSTQGQIAKDGGASIINKEGKLTYQEEKVKAAEVVYNLMTTPRGRTYSLILSDGTKVWLNASSSIRYPTAFTGNERTVDITGEAYFEVAHNASKPFKVNLPGGGLVEDIGTAFNINAYNDEDAIKTTLLEGSVRVTANTQSTHNSLIIKPGQQAVLANSYQLTANSSADLEEVMAWKNGRFYFHSADLSSVLRQATRWYDIEVQYTRKVDTRFNGEVDRNTNLSNLLKALELSGGVQFEVKGNKIIVK